MNLNKNLTLNTTEILYTIQDELMTIMENNSYHKMGYNVKVALERNFVKLKQYSPKTIYVVVKFLAADLNYGQLNAPFTITAVSEENDIEICYKLLLEFAETYNLKFNEDETILQSYTSPILSNAFQYVAAGYRAVLYMSGTFLISENANRLKLKYIYVSSENNYVSVKPNTIVSIFKYAREELKWEDYGSLKISVYPNDNTLEIWNEKEQEWETVNMFLEGIHYSGPEANYTFELIERDINALTRTVNLNIQLDTQGFFKTNNYTKSEAQLGTLTFNASMNLLSDCPFCNRLLDLVTKKVGINNSFPMLIKFLQSGHELYDIFKVASISSQENVASLPLISVVMTN